MKFCRKVLIISVQCAGYDKLIKIPKLKKRTIENQYITEYFLALSVSNSIR